MRVRFGVPGAALNGFEGQNTCRRLASYVNRSPAAREFKPLWGWLEAEEDTRRRTGRGSRIFGKKTMLVTGRRSRRRLGREAEVIQNFFCRSRLFYPCDLTYGPTTSFGVCTIMRYLAEFWSQVMRRLLQILFVPQKVFRKPVIRGPGTL